MVRIKNLFSFCPLWLVRPNKDLIVAARADTPKRGLMSELLVLGTSKGVIVCQRQDGEWRPSHRGLAEQSVTSVIAREGVILAGTRQGVYRSDDEGRTWQEARAGLSTRYVRWMAYHPDFSDFELAGSEPAGIFVSRDGARTWRTCPEVEALRDANGWYLPYSPEAGCVRGFAIHGQRAYAAVEVGGVLVSDDGGETWRLAPGSLGKPLSPPERYIHPDVHSILVHPGSPERVLAPTGGGFFRSQDGGATWELIYPSYCRAAWQNPANDQHILLGPADFVDRNGRIEESLDGGNEWHPVSQGLHSPWPRHMVERFYPAGDELLAILSNGEMLVTSQENIAWRRTLGDVEGVHAAAMLDD